MATAATSALTRATIVVATRMIVAMMVTGRTRDIGKLSRKECVYCLISIAADTGKDQYSRLSQCVYCTVADAAADEGGYFIFFQILGECAMTAYVWYNDC